MTMDARARAKVPAAAEATVGASNHKAPGKGMKPSGSPGVGDIDIVKWQMEVPHRNTPSLCML